MGHKVEYLYKAVWVIGVLLSSEVALAAPGDGNEGAPESLVPVPEASGLLQVWATAWDQDEEPSTDPASYGDPEDDPGFKVRRARVGLEGDGDQFRYALMVGVSSPFDLISEHDDSVGLVDAYGATRLTDRVWMSLGLQKVPVSREMLMSSGDLSLGERSVATEWIAPGRDIGLVIDAATGGELQFRGRAGVFNGNNDPMGDDDPGMLMSMRAEVVSGSANLEQTYGTVDGLNVGFGIDGWYDQSFSTTTFGAGGDFALRTRGLSFLVEGRLKRVEPVAHADVEPPEVWSQTDLLGGMAQVGYTLGPWEPALQFSYFDDSTSADDNGDVNGLMAGITWHGTGDTTRIGGGYVKRIERSGAVSPNDTVRFWLQTRL